MDVTEMSVHLRILILLAAFSSAAAGNLVINPVGEAHTRALGTSIVFTCSVMGIPPNVKPELRWTDGEGKDITNTQGTVYIEKDGEQALKLYITSIVANDAGDYSCSGIIEGNRVTLKTTLLLYKDITFDDAPALQYPRIYTDALIKCRVSGQPVPTVTWRHGGEKIQTGGRYENEIDGLRIMNITEEDNGRYICRAEVAAEGRLKEKQIDVEAHIPPKITEKMKDMQEIEDHNVTLRCKASGKPDPKYEFYKDGVDAPLFSKNHVIVDGSRGMIHFAPLNKIDEGTYSCKAINDVGTDTTGAKLKVIVRPTIWELRDTQAEEGKQGKLLCKSSGDPPPEMTWRKSPHNDYDYSNGPNEGGRIIVQKVNPGELELVINNVTPDDTSNYTCSATNQGGNDKKNGTFAAQFSPRFDPNHPNVVYSWAGKTRNVTCIALGEPEPHIRWYRKNDLIDQKNETFRDYSEGRVGKLQITVRDGNQHWIFDQYICRAINEFGQKELAIQLQRATVPDKPRSVEVLDSSPTMVELAVTPPLENGGVEVYGFRVEFMDGIQDFNLGQDIRLENLKPSTTYIFSIRAKNEVGVSDVLDYVYQTEAIREPYPIVIISDPESRYSYSYDIRWELPRTGGLPIKEYWFKYRRVSVYEGTWDFQKPLEDFTKLEVQDNPQTPMMFFTLEGLKPNAYYQVEVIAHNDIGESIARPFIFRTKEGPDGTNPGGVVGSAVSMETSLLATLVTCLLALLL